MSHSSNILLIIILKRLTPHAETILEDETAGFRKNRSTLEHILNCKFPMEKTYRSSDLYIITS